MKNQTTIKNAGLNALNMFDSKGELIATVVEMVKLHTDYGLGMYRVCIYGGPAHGKVAYARDFQDLNDKSVEIAALV